MNNRNLTRITPIDAESAQREVWLLGQPPLQNYLHFVKEHVIGGEAMPPAGLVDEWRAANDYYAELEEAEAGDADAVEILDLDPALRPLVEEVGADPRFRRAFDALPVRFAMVELDRLMVSQPYVSEHHTDRIANDLADAPTGEGLFRFCLPLGRDEAAVQVRKTGSRSYMFWSPSTDFRFQEAMLLNQNQAPGAQSFGPVAGIVGVMVGYGSNFLNAIQSENRLLLHNGYHRAYALRSIGITHAPCVVQTVTRVDELKLVAAKSVVEDPAFYFKAKRPPLLKDFFDPRIRKVHTVHSMANVVEIAIEVKEMKKIRDFSATAPLAV